MNINFIDNIDNTDNIYKLSILELVLNNKNKKSLVKRIFIKYH